MTSPLSHEAVAQMVADREAGTPGPWHFDGPVWNQIIWTDGENRLCFMAHSNGLNDDRDIANARRIASLPDLEAAYLTLAAENATLLAERDEALRLLDNSRQIERNVQSVREHEHKRAEAALSDLATLRASEAAAMERVKVLTEALEEILSIDSYESRETFDGSNKHVVITKFGEFGQIAHAALTPTSDKEPKT